MQPASATRIPTRKTDLSPQSADAVQTCAHTGRVVKAPDAVHVPQAEHELVLDGHAAADEAGVPSLGHDADAALVAIPDNCTHFLRGAWAEHSGGAAMILVHPIIVVGLEVRYGCGGEGGEDRRLREDLGELCEVGLCDGVELRVEARRAAGERSRGEKTGDLGRAVHSVRRIHTGTASEERQSWRKPSHVAPAHIEIHSAATPPTLFPCDCSPRYSIHSA